MNKGILYSLSAYIFWGLHPIYWKLLSKVQSSEIVAHRIFWSLIFFSILLSFRKEWGGIINKIKQNGNRMILFIPALLIGSNWSLYIWAVNAGFIIETSLGYFISPLVSVFLGLFFLGETLRKAQWVAVIIACSGVLTMTFIYGQFPWIALFLAGTWGVYGLLRKKSPLNSIEGLTLETALLSIPALIYLGYLTTTGDGSFFIGSTTTVLLIGCGVMSGLPLLIYITGARMISLSLVGILQYIYPTLLFLVGAFIYGEPLHPAKMTGFIFIWVALIIYSVDGTFFLKRKKVALSNAD